MKLFFLSVLCSLLVARTSTAADITGDWKGTWTKDGDGLPVTVTFRRSGNDYAGSFDSDALQTTEIPFSEVIEKGDNIHFALKGDESTMLFDGTLTGNTIAGTILDGQRKGTFELTRCRLPADSIQSREVTFGNNEVRLAGTMYLPAGADKNPAVIFLHGSGPEGRWANQYLAEKFARAGIVALIYDKRGVGKSSGDWQKAGFEELAEDAVAGIRFLRSRAQVDPARIGIYGHSQGGTIAPLVAVRAGGLAFVIASAAGGIAPADLEAYSVGNSINIAELPRAEQEEARAYIDTLIGVAYRGRDRAPLDAMAVKFKSRIWFFEPPPPDNSYWAISRQIASFDPARWWRLVQAPVLLAYGAHDQRVPPGASARAIQTALASGGNNHVTLKMFPDSDHTFTIVNATKKGGWPKHDPTYFETLSCWLRNAGLATHDQ